MLDTAFSISTVMRVLRRQAWALFWNSYFLKTVAHHYAHDTCQAVSGRFSKDKVRLFNCVWASGGVCRKEMRHTVFYKRVVQETADTLDLADSLSLGKHNKTPFLSKKNKQTD